MHSNILIYTAHEVSIVQRIVAQVREQPVVDGTVEVFGRARAPPVGRRSRGDNFGAVRTTLRQRDADAVTSWRRRRVLVLLWRARREGHAYSIGKGSWSTCLVLSGFARSERGALSVVDWRRRGALPLHGRAHRPRYAQCSIKAKTIRVEIRMGMLWLSTVAASGAVGR